MFLGHPVQISKKMWGHKKPGGLWQEVWVGCVGVHDEVKGAITGRCKSHRLEGVHLEMRHQTLPDQKKRVWIRREKEMILEGQQLTFHGPWTPWGKSWTVDSLGRKNNIRDSHLSPLAFSRNGKEYMQDKESNKQTKQRITPRPRWYQGLVLDPMHLQMIPGQGQSVPQSLGRFWEPAGCGCQHVLPPTLSESTSQMALLGPPPTIALQFWKHLLGGSGRSEPLR